MCWIHFHASCMHTVIFHSLLWVNIAQLWNYKVVLCKAHSWLIALLRRGQCQCRVGGPTFLNIFFNIVLGVHNPNPDPALRVGKRVCGLFCFISWMWLKHMLSPLLLCACFSHFFVFFFCFALFFAPVILHAADVFANVMQRHYCNYVAGCRHKCCHS